MPQLSLFGAPEEVATHHDPRDAELGARLPSWLRLGTSSWTFPGWNGIVYAGRPSHAALVRAGLRAYARHPLFRTVGIDRAYYGPLTAEQLAEYAAQLPPGFLAISKVWEDLTAYVFPEHPRYGDRAGRRNPRFLDPAAIRDEVLAAYEASFAEHAGPFVFEIPPMPRDALPADDELARAILRLARALPPRFRYAFELRDRALLRPRYFAALREIGAAHVFNFWSRMPTLREQLALGGATDAPFAVARLMLPPGTRYEDQRALYEPFDKLVAPEPEMRADVVRLAQVFAGRDVFVIANNKAEGSSPLTIRALAELLAAALPR